MFVTPFVFANHIFMPLFKPKIINSQHSLEFGLNLAKKIRHCPFYYDHTFLSKHNYKIPMQQIKRIWILHMSMSLGET